ncbi:hypothetical protein [Turicimonas muris]|uniref:hypothetical protein n=1 Tax=Turicimonas muris TaxID=1796652 RepID=UPI0023F126AA|nr:hypothetical protein [Turicimonas muris]
MRKNKKILRWLIFAVLGAFLFTTIIPLAVSSALSAWFIGLVVTTAVAAAVYLIATNLY